TERQGARMLTHAASCPPISSSASASALARSGRLVSTKSFCMSQPLTNGRVAKREAELALQTAVVEAPRLAHERVEPRRHASRRLAAPDPLRPRQPGM